MAAPTSLAARWTLTFAMAVLLAAAFAPVAEAAVLNPDGSPVASDPNLVGWWKADAGLWADTAGTVAATDGGAVARWDNQANSAMNATQGNVGDQPIFRQSEARFGGAAAVDFVSADRLFSDVVPATGNGDRTLIAVFADDQGSQTNAFYAHVVHYGSSANPWGAFGITGHTANQSDAGTFGSGLPANPGNHYWGRRGSGNRPPSPDATIFTSDFSSASKVNRMYANGLGSGSVTITDTAGLVTGSDRGITIGGIQSHAGNEAFNGAIAEVIAYSETLSPADRRAIEGYLGTKYGVTLPPVPVPQAAPVTYADFSDVSDFTLNLAAAQVGNRIRLTPTINNQSGSAFVTDPITVGEDHSFSASFSFEITDTGNGADGLTFAVHTDPAGGTATGAFGYGIGLAGIQPVVAVEVDTWATGAWDQGGNGNRNHIAIDTSASTESLQQAHIAGNFRDGATRYAWVDYNGTAKKMDVFLATSNTKPAVPTLSARVDLGQILGTQTDVFVGFTAGTGGLNANHDVLSLSFDAAEGQRMVDLTTAGGREANYAVGLGRAYSDSVIPGKADTGVVEIGSGRGNGLPWWTINDGNTSIGQNINTFAVSSAEDLIGYQFKVPVKNLSQIDFVNRVFGDGGTFDAEPTVQWLDAPAEQGGMWHDMAVTWGNPYDRSLGWSARSYAITPVDQEMTGIWGIRLIGPPNADSAPGSDPDGFIGLTELRVWGEVDLNVDFRNNLAAQSNGATAIMTHAQYGNPAAINDGDLTTREQTFGAGNQGEDYVGVVWDEPQDWVGAVGITFKRFVDGGLFDDAVSPMRIEVTTDGSTWVPVTGLDKLRYPDVYPELANFANPGGVRFDPEFGFLFTFDQQFGILGIRAIGDPDGTVDGDGFLGVFEFEVFQSVPEPSSVVLLVLGGLGLVGLGWRRSKRA